MWEAILEYVVCRVRIISRDDSSDDFIKFQFSRRQCTIPSRIIGIYVCTIVVTPSISLSQNRVRGCIDSIGERDQQYGFAWFRPSDILCIIENGSHLWLGYLSPAFSLSQPSSLLCVLLVSLSWLFKFQEGLALGESAPTCAKLDGECRHALNWNAIISIVDNLDIKSTWEWYCWHHNICTQENMSWSIRIRRDDLCDLVKWSLKGERNLATATASMHQLQEGHYSHQAISSSSHLRLWPGNSFDQRFFWPITLDFGKVIGYLVL